MPPMRRVAWLLLVLVACRSQPSAPKRAAATAIVGVTVVHPERAAAEAEVADQTIVLEDDR